jgi:hypothetical protein
LNEVRAFLLLEPTPSEADIRITRDLIRAGQILNIEVLHHIVIGNPNHTGLRSLCYFGSVAEFVGEFWAASPSFARGFNSGLTAESGGDKFSVAPNNAELLGDSAGILTHHLCFAFATRHYMAATRIINHADDVLVSPNAYPETCHQTSAFHFWTAPVSLRFE